MSGRGEGIVVRDAWCVFEHVSGRKVEALREVTLEIPGGQFVCIVGRSGHGKSTLLRALGGLNPLSRGEVVVDGVPVAGPSAERGMVFQDETVFPWMRVRANVEFGLRAQGMSATERARIARDWLRRVELSEFVEAWPRELSGGMRRRVALATVFAGGAPILLMDEPFGALDYVTRLSLHRLLLDLWRNTGRTIVFVTHDIEEALILADRILVIMAGRVVGDLQVALPRPRDEEVRARPEAVGMIKTIMHHLSLDSPGADSFERAPELVARR